MNILAMDLGKNKTVFCSYNSMTGNYEFGKVKTVPQHIHDLIVEKEPQRVVLEICGAAGWVVDIAKVLDKQVQVANTTHEGWRWKNVKKKNDREDALKLAKLSAMNQLPTVHIPDKEIREKRALIQYRNKLVRRRTRIKNTIRAILLREGITMPVGKKAWTKAAIQELKKLARPLGKISDINQLWQGQLHTELGLLRAVCEAIEKVENRLDKLADSDVQIRRLQTVAGVGPRLAEAIVAFLDDPRRFGNGKQVSSYVGLTPKRYQSGRIDRQGRISGQGNKLLRTLLVEVSWVALRYDSWARQTYIRLLRGSPSRKNVAIIAVARKLLVRCWAMLRDKKEWKDNIEKKAA